jgi:ABC-type Fe3+-citrate transport system substrate-binding protein
VLKAEHDSFQEFLKESTEKETREEKEREEKHPQAIAELNDKLKKSNARIKTLIAKAKTSKTEAENIDKLIFRKDLLVFSGFFILILPLSQRELTIVFHSDSRIRMETGDCHHDRSL